MNDQVKKYSLLILMVMSVLISNGQPGAVKDSLAAAGQLYTGTKYQDCIRKYQYVLARGFESAEVYYNLGNAFYKSGNATYAILNYERAKKLAPNDDDIQYNLELARTQVVDNIVPLSGPGLIRWWWESASAVPINIWGILSITTFFMFLALFGLFLLSGTFRVKRLSFWISVAAISVSAITFAIGENLQSNLVNHNTAVITDRSVRVKASPSETGTELFIVHEGVSVRVTDQIGEWLYISLPDGNKGWVKEAMLIRI